MTATIDDIHDEDWYSILEVPSSASEEQISQSYRKLARKYHPDRNHDNPKAAEMFLKIKKASDVLMNETMRKEYDSKVQARLLRKKKREEGDASLRKMRDDLEARENAHKRQKISEEETKRRNQVDLQQMREDALRKREAQAQKRAAASAERDSAHQSTNTDERSSSFDDGSINIKWKPKKIQFTKENLETIYRAYGPLKHLVISTNKPGRAVVAYENLDHARTAMRELKHHNPYGFKCEWSSGKEPEAAFPFNAAPFSTSSTAAPVPPAMDTSVADLDAFEAEVMRKMQEAAKKKKAAAAAAATASSSPSASTQQNGMNNDAMDTQ